MGQNANNMCCVVAGWGAKVNVLRCVVWFKTFTKGERGGGGYRAQNTQQVCVRGGEGLGSKTGTGETFMGCSKGVVGVGGLRGVEIEGRVWGEGGVRTYEPGW